MVHKNITSLVLLGILAGSVWSQQPALDFRIELEPGNHSRSKPVVCKMLLRNVGQQPILANTRFLVNWPGAFPHEVYFRVFDDQGKLQPFLLLIRAGNPEDRDFTMLQPGQQSEAKYDLNYCYQLRPCTYEVEAVYENRHQPVGQTESWTGRLRSQRLVLKVE